MLVLSEADCFLTACQGWPIVFFVAGNARLERKLMCKITCICQVHIYKYSCQICTFLFIEIVALGLIRLNLARRHLRGKTVILQFPKIKLPGELEINFITMWTISFYIGLHFSNLQHHENNYIWLSSLKSLVSDNLEKYVFLSF